MSDNKSNSPTIEQSLRMIEEKLAEEKKGKKKDLISKNNKKISKSSSTDFSFSNLFKKEKSEKNAIKTNKVDEVFLLTKKIDDEGKIIDLKRKKVLTKKPKSKVKNEAQEVKKERINVDIKNYRTLSKTGDLAVIINKLKEIRDHKMSKIKKKKHSNKIKQEIRKLNETIVLAEDLFKKELLNL